MVRDAQAAAQAGDVRKALARLRDHTIEAKGDGAIVAAEQWLSLGKAGRENTSIYASGRKIRSAVNAAVQQGLAANGEVGPGKIELLVLDRVNTTREELRHLSAYREGRVLEVSRREKTLGLTPGEYRILGQDRKGQRIEAENRRGKRFSFDPSRIRAGTGGDGLRCCSSLASSKSMKATVSAGRATIIAEASSMPTGQGWSRSTREGHGRDLQGRASRVEEG